MRWGNRKLSPAVPSVLMFILAIICFCGFCLYLETASNGIEQFIEDMRPAEESSDKLKGKKK